MVRNVVGNVQLRGVMARDTSLASTLHTTVCLAAHSPQTRHELPSCRHCHLPMLMQPLLAWMGREMQLMEQQLSHPVSFRQMELWKIRTCCWSTGIGHFLAQDLGEAGKSKALLLLTSVVYQLLNIFVTSLGVLWNSKVTKGWTR